LLFGSSGGSPPFGEIGQAFIEFPPMQKPASFNLEAVREQLFNSIKSHAVH
jgi:hypothetical protein